jgi:hypothetical protein
VARFTLWVVQQNPQDVAPRCFFEFAEGVAYSLRQLGHEVAFVQGASPYSYALPDSRAIVFNGHCLPAIPLAPDTIIYNAEQVQVDAWKAANYAGLLRRHAVWDYSTENIGRLAQLGVTRVTHCPVGYYPGLTDIKPAPQEDLDVLFIGWMNERRTKIVNDLARRGVKVRALTGVYGEERNAWLARAKIVLNIHFYEKPVFEIFRVSHLLANKKCVVSEDSGCDAGLEAFAAQATTLVPYDKIPAAVATLLLDKDKRREQAARGFEAFSKLDQVAIVKAALEASP